VVATTGTDNDLLEAYIREAAQAGCPPDQIVNFIRAGIVLQPKQLQAAAAARLCDSPDGPVEIGYGGARGGGKSAWVFAQLAADDCQRMPGLKALVLRNVGRAAVEALDDLRRKLLTKLPHRYLANRGVLIFPNGSRILTGYFDREEDINVYLGLEYDVIAVEEATTISFATYMLIKSCCRTSNPLWRPRIYTTTNPGGVGHQWYKQRFIDPWREGRERETRFIPALVDDNRFIDPGYVAVLEQQTGWRLRAWRYGDWDVGAGQFFSTFSRQHHVLDDVDETIAREWFAGLDYGFTHYTVFVLGFRSGDGDFYIVDLYKARKALVETNAEAIKALLARHQVVEYSRYGGARPRPLTPDDLAYIAAGRDAFGKKSNGLSVADEYRANGIPLTPANDDRVSGAATILKLLGDPMHGVKPRLFFHRRCEWLVDQLVSMQHDPNHPEDVMKVDVDESGVGGDDGYDALRYALHAPVRSVKQVRLMGV
jgi:hypothetical protein